MRFPATSLFFSLLLIACVRSAERPNVVVLLSDDAGYREFSMQGSKKISTPRIDSIAANGVRFSTAYSSGLVCCPTRCGLLTGRYQQRFGNELNLQGTKTGLSLDETTFPQLLKSDGYRTIALGKWHLGYEPKFHPLERGFTDYYGFLQGHRSYFPLTKSTVMNRLLRDREPAPEKFTYMTDHLGEEAAAYIAKHKAEPFFLYLAFNATHGPLDAFQPDLDKTGGTGNPAKIHAMTTALDRAVGVVLDELAKHSLTDNTLVIFTNDNGGEKGHDNGHLRGHKGQVWEGGIRVPMAMQWPARLPKGKVVAHPVITLDLYPTIMATTGSKQVPPKPLDGVNLLPVALGESSAPPHAVLHWKMREAFAVREGNLKLLRAGQQGGAPELYDLAADESEKNNLAASRPDDVARLLKLHNTWKADFPKVPAAPAGKAKPGKKKK